MANLLQEYINLQKQLEETSRLLERSKGKLDILRERLFKSFGVKTEEKGRTLLERICKEAKSLEENLQKAYEEFEQKWGDRLNES